MDVVVKDLTKILNRGIPENVLWYLRNSKTTSPNYKVENVELVPEKGFDEGEFRNTESTFFKNGDVQ